MVRAVRQACATEDTALLASLSAPDATAFFDGGGKVRTLVSPVHGSRQVAQSLLTLLARRPRTTTLHTHSANGRTGLVVRYNDQVAAVISLDIAGHHAVQVWVILNPDKLRPWNQRTRKMSSLSASVGGWRARARPGAGPVRNAARTVLRPILAILDEAERQFVAGEYPNQAERGRTVCTSGSRRTARWTVRSWCCGPRSAPTTSRAPRSGR